MYNVQFKVSEQSLVKTGGISTYASDTVEYIKAEFTFDESWDDYGSIKAIWQNGSVSKITPLGTDNQCSVPAEVLTEKGTVKVNLVGTNVDGEEVSKRITTYQVDAFRITVKVKIDASDPQPISPSEYEQFVALVKDNADRAEAGADRAKGEADRSSGEADRAESEAEQATASAQASETSAGQAYNYASEASASATLASQYAQNAEISATSAENAKDEAEDARDEIRSMRAEAETLSAGSDATASYADGVLSLGIPRGDTGATGAKGDKGDTGATPNLSIGTVETLEPTEDATATITGTAENPVLNLGLPKGEQGDVNLSQLYSLLPTDTASGDIATFTDGADDVPMESLKVALEPIQDTSSGQPSPTNICPISGWDAVKTYVRGANLWDEVWELGGINNQTGANGNASDRIRSKNHIPCLPNTSYYFKLGGSNWNAYYYDADKNFISRVGAYNDSRALTTPSNAYYVRFWKTGTTYNNDISINYPSTDHDYHAYNGTDITTTLPQTVYGGTLDVVTGELVVDRAMVDLGSLTWSLYNTVFYATVSGIAHGQSRINIVSDRYATADAESSVGGGSSWVDGTIRGNSANAEYIYIKDTRYATASEFKTAMNGVMACIPIATPQTYQLTPQEVKSLLGDNNVWSDGTVTVIYRADIQKYIDKAIATAMA